jgi:four helix bundle protein
MTETEKVKIKSFTDLNAWREGHSLVLQIYKITRSFPKDEIYCLVSQMRRAAISITSNIAEGFGRHGYREKIQFYYLAQGSLLELKNQILVAKDVGYIKNEDLKLVAQKANDAHRLLQGLITSSKSFLNHKS